MYSLLIVDDENIIVDGLADMLSEYDLPIKYLKTAYSAKAALELFRQSPFDIVLSDILMPEMDGIELLKTIREIWKSTKFIFLTGFTDFKYTQQAIKLNAADYLLKPVEDRDVVKCIRKVISELDHEYDQILEISTLKDKVKKAMNDMKGVFFRDMLECAGELKIAELDRKFKELDLPFLLDASIDTAIIRIDDWGQHFNENDTNLVQFAVHNILSELLINEWNLLAFNYREGLIGVILQRKKESDSLNMAYLLEKQLEEVQDAIYRALDITISIALDENILWNQWVSRFIFLAAKLKQNLGNGKMIVATDEMKIPRDERHINLLSNMVLNIRSGDENAFMSNMDSVVNDFQNTDGENNNSMALFFLELSSNMLSLAIEYNVSDALDPISIEKMTNLYAFKNIVDMKEFLINIFYVITGKISEVGYNSSTDIIKLIKSYIDSNLKEELSLVYLSKKFHINPSYLSRTFRQVTGTNLISYVISAKIEFAKKLLSNENLKVYEVSQSVGYDNPNYFAKAFRKNVGVSPQDYRNLCIRKSN